ncbi:hypothetical protein E4Z66_01510 [Aliishimia ponticola]|uniref:Uncharacterized protein n=1 Tax=Aliishimia ponticola TaxID=2499833 RepID=A0A4S4NHW0_9RHOB|nr:hypothetical protein [Aliishimia ponticola]THH38277.1 hypothetical protein E4Z66_01510 [Aliishimia ponticola]
MELATNEASRAPAISQYSAVLEMPSNGPVRDVLYLSHLFAGLMHGLGHPVTAIEKPGNLQITLKSEKFRLMLRSDEASLFMSIIALKANDPAASQDAEYLLARLIGAVNTVLHPVAIRWQNSEEPIDARSWVSRVVPIRPRRAMRRAGKVTARPQEEFVQVYPNRPWDAPNRARFAAIDGTVNVVPLHGETSAETAEKVALYQQLEMPQDDQTGTRKSEALPVRLCSWALTGVTAALMPPAGASLAVINLVKGSDVWLSVQALVLTVIILGLYQSGVLAQAFAALGL